MRFTECARWLALVPTCLVQLSASSAELAPLGAIELHRLCIGYAEDAEGIHGKACAAYIRGFIEGSALVRVDLPAPPGESFTERAFRTRLGNGNARARYCVDGSVTVAALVIQLLVQAEGSAPTESDTASDLIQATLNRFHRCRAGSGK
jgi:hypothetical protein